MRFLPGLAAVVSALLLAGCLGGLEERAPRSALGTDVKMTFRVHDAATSKPVSLARVTLLADAEPLVAVATDRNGTAPVLVPAAATDFEVVAQGYLPHRGDLDPLVRLVVVNLRPVSQASDAFDGSFGLHFRPAVDLGSRSYGIVDVGGRKFGVAVGTSCVTDDTLGDQDADCGLGEPSVEVDARGTIYVSGVCCIGNAPPVYVSRDDGKTFQELTTTTGVREKFGIEGDFAIDAQGVLYFSDIELAATFQVTAWDADGRFLRHTKWPAPPLVDRDWIRAEGNGHLYYVYNTGGSTNVYTSQDGGATWSLRPVFTAPYGLGNAVRGTRPGELWILGGGLEGKRRADFTLDGGMTWKSEKTSALLGGGFPTGAFDEAGNLYVTGAPQDRIYVSRRSPDGSWSDAFMVTPDFGHHRMPWIAAGGAGKAAVAWYGTLEEKTDATWFLFVAVSLDADAPDPHWQVAIADPEPILVGNLGRQLLDFLQVEIGPDGAVHVAYSKLRPNEPNNEEKLHYVHSEPTLPLAAARYPSGPV